MRGRIAWPPATWQRMEKPFHRRAKELGYEVKKVEPVTVTPTLVT